MIPGFKLFAVKNLFNILGTALSNIGAVHSYSMYSSFSRTFQAGPFSRKNVSESA